MTRDPLDDAGSRDPGVSALFDHLTRPGTPDELAGEQAARAMFAAANAVRAQPRTAGITQSPPRQLASRRTADRRTRKAPVRRGGQVGGRLIAAATVIAAAFGFAAAGYAEVLPPPLQHVAYQILGFAGVPNAPGSPGSTLTSGPAASRSRHPGGRPTSAQPTTGGQASPSPSPGTTSSTSASPSPRHHSPRPGSPSPTPSSPGSPSPSGPVSLLLSAAQSQIVAGDSVQFTGSLTKDGQPEPGIRLTLLELIAGHSTWKRVAHARTGAQGELTLTVSAVTKNAAFLIADPHGARSSEVSVVVAPPVSLSVARVSHRVDRLAVASPLAQRGDVVELEVSASDGSWRVLQTHRLHKAGRTAFTVVVRKVSLTYRAVVLATDVHGQSVSTTVTVAGRTPKAQGAGSR